MAEKTTKHCKIGLTPFLFFDPFFGVGLVMFSVPIVFGWLAPYAADLIPGYPGNVFTYAIVGDLLLLVSLFVLGGDFWDKLRALFIGGAKAVFPKTTG